MHPLPRASISPLWIARTPLPQVPTRRRTFRPILGLCEGTDIASLRSENELWSLVFQPLWGAPQMCAAKSITWDGDGGVDCCKWSLVSRSRGARSLHLPARDDDAGHVGCLQAKKLAKL